MNTCRVVKTYNPNLWDDFFPRTAASSYIPDADIAEFEDKYTLTLDVPGVQKADLKVEIENRILRISGERKRKEESTAKHTTWGRSYGAFARAFSLPDDIELESLKAEHREGVLYLEIFKSKQSRSRVVEIK